jgi:hypothetical protein
MGPAGKNPKGGEIHNGQTDTGLEKARRLARSLRHKKDFAGALVQYEILIKDREDHLEPHERTNNEYLELRRQKGYCLCKISSAVLDGEESGVREEVGSNNGVGNKDTHRIAEDYLRETLKLWRKKEELQEAPQKGTAHTSIELAQCLVRAYSIDQVWDQHDHIQENGVIDEVSHNMDENWSYPHQEPYNMGQEQHDYVKAIFQEVLQLVKCAFQFLGYSKEMKTKDKDGMLIQLEDLIGFLLEIAWTAEEMAIAPIKALEDAEELYRSALELWGEGTYGLLQEQQAAFGEKLADALCLQRKYGESIEVYQAISQSYPEAEGKYDQDILRCRAKLERTRQLRTLRILSWFILHLRKIRELRSTRTKSRWKKYLLYARLQARYVIRVAKRAKMRWRKAYVSARLVVVSNRMRLEAFERQKQAEANWSDVIKVVFAYTKITKCRRSKLERLKAVQRQHNAQANWSYATSVLLVYNKIANRRKFKLERLAAIKRQYKAKENWSYAIHIMLSYTKIAKGRKSVLGRRERQSQAQARWVVIKYTVYMYMRMVKVAEQRRHWARRRKAEANWREAISAARVYRKLIAIAKMKRAAIYSDDSDDDNSEIGSVDGNALFGVDGSSKAQKDDEATKLLKSYEHFCFWLKYNSQIASAKTPVKIAVIDTGIDASNEYIKGKWPPSGKPASDYYKNFYSNTTAPDDKDGHGTHIAGLILHYAEKAHLYVCRIGNKRSKISRDDQLGTKVAAAINHATTVWGVDLISLSMGMTYKHKADVDKAIANAESKNVVIFASACNDGERKGISYPADHRSVFCVGAVKGYGSKSDFAPRGTRRKNVFCILGENILSTWPTKLGPAPGATEDVGVFVRPFSSEKINCMTNYMTGTSFATPLMVALIANLYAYYREHEDNIWKDIQYDYLTKLCSFDGVEKLLYTMSETQGNDSVIAPWKDPIIFFTYEVEKNIYSALRQTLLSWHR